MASTDIKVKEIYHVSDEIFKYIKNSKDQNAVHPDVYKVIVDLDKQKNQILKSKADKVREELLKSKEASE